jgi:hypothetical protein
MSKSSSYTFPVASARLVGAFPWLNGVVLSHTKRSFFQQNLENSNHAKALVDMVLVRLRVYPRLYRLTHISQVMAEQVDSLASIMTEDEDTHDFLQRYLCVGKDRRSFADVRSIVLHIGKSAPNPRHLHPAANVLFRYKLLDIMASVLGLPAHKDLETVPPMPPPLQRVDRLVKVEYSYIFSVYCLSIIFTGLSIVEKMARRCE